MSWGIFDDYQDTSNKQIGDFDFQKFNNLTLDEASPGESYVISLGSN